VFQVPLPMRHSNMLASPWEEFAADIKLRLQCAGELLGWQCVWRTAGLSSSSSSSVGYVCRSCVCGSLLSTLLHLGTVLIRRVMV
jgi:hypothetical protein